MGFQAKKIYRAGQKTHAVKGRSANHNRSRW